MKNEQPSTGFPLPTIRRYSLKRWAQLLRLIPMVRWSRKSIVIISPQHPSVWRMTLSGWCLRLDGEAVWFVMNQSCLHLVFREESVFGVSGLIPLLRFRVELQGNSFLNLASKERLLSNPLKSPNLNKATVLLLKAACILLVIDWRQLIIQRFLCCSWLG